MSSIYHDSEAVRRAPRAPSQEDWERLTDEERIALIERLPARMSDAEFTPPEGDPHRIAKMGAFEALDEFFRRMGRRVYVAPDLTVYYPAEPRFAPDVLAVLDVDPHLRDKWVVSAEGKGLDWVLEVHVSGDWRKDLERNVEFYAHLGIPEYFVFEVRQRKLSGYTLPLSGTPYRPIIPQAGRYHSQILGLDLMVTGDRLRFFAGNAPLYEREELVRTLEQAVDQQQQRAEALAQRLAETEAETARRLAEAKAETARLRAEIEKLRREK